MEDKVEAEQASPIPHLADDSELVSVLLRAVEELGEGLVITEAGRCAYANQTYQDMTGYSLEELRAMPSLLDLAPEDEREELTERLRSRLAGGAALEHYEAGLITKDGARKDVEVAVKVLDPKGGDMLLVSIVRDVTDRKALEDFKDQFIARASHELKNPVALVSGLASMLQDRRDAMDDERIGEVIVTLSRQTKRLQRLVSHLLDLAKFDRGELKVDPAPTSVSETLTASIEALAEPQGRSIGVEVPEDLIAWVDPVRLDEILTNLLSNALKYGEVVTVRAEAAGQRLWISVTDDGPGVPESFRHVLFEAFHRGSNASGEGSGLGLAIIKTLAQVSGGEVSYEDMDPHGSRFTVWLPRPKE